MTTLAGSGLVSLVGAGPGDPELITRKGARRLEEADLVLYDALVAPGTLELAPRAMKVSVGKRAGRRSTRQESIHALLIRAARRGRRVVRLKCGDPFVLGRGGEEVLALAAAGIPCEVVPGLTTAVAAPALAGIPVTHRGLSSAFAVVSGHAEAAWGPVLDSLAPHSATLVVLMGLGSRAALVERLRSRGWSAATPAAVLLAISHPGERSWTGTLGSLAEARWPDEGLPGTLVIGDVVSLARARAESVPGAARAR
jgi:uroporphyrin-III C-methyltransferase/precorrin-2 dehydrogenase/sirohydrochlorin ferrochelatase